MPRVFGSFSATHLCFQVLEIGILFLTESLSSMQPPMVLPQFTVGTYPIGPGIRKRLHTLLGTNRAW